MFQCCFCGGSIEGSEKALIEINIPMEEESSQNLYAHKKCLKERLHPTVPIGFDE